MAAIMFTCDESIFFFGDFSLSVAPFVDQTTVAAGNITFVLAHRETEGFQLKATVLPAARVHRGQVLPRQP